MKKSGKAGLLVAILGFLLAAPAIHSQETIDLVILLDSSQRMFTYYNEVVEFVITGVASKYLRFGDTFHLISFAETTQIEIMQTVRTDQDVSAAVARLYLLYPFGKNSDMIAALRNTYQYVSDLPLSNRKLIIMITDGIHAPPPSSSFYEFSAEQVQQEITRLATEYRGQDWLFEIVTVPFKPAAAGSVPPNLGSEGEAAPGSGSYVNDLATALNTDISTFEPGRGEETVNAVIVLPQLSFPADLGRRRYSFKLPVSIENKSDSVIHLEITNLIADNTTDILAERRIISLPPHDLTTTELLVEFPKAWPHGRTTLVLEPKFADNIRVVPAISTVELELYTNPVLSFFDNTLWLLLLLVILALTLALVFIVVYFIHRMHRKADSPVVNTVLDSTSNRPAFAPSRAEPAATSFQSGSAAARSVAQGNPALRSNQALNSSPAHAVNPAMPATYKAENSAAILGRSDAGRTTGATILGSRSAVGQDSLTVLAKAKPAPQTWLTAANQSQAAASASILGGKPAIRQPPTAGPQPSAVQKSSTDVLAQWVQNQPATSNLGPAKARSTAPVINRPTTSSSHYAPEIIRPGTIRVELGVAGQNRAIGLRNIKTLHAGGRKSLGGGNDDFLIFLLPIGRHIADIYYNGVDLTLDPHNLAALPDFNGPTKLAFGQSIRVISRHGRELSITFTHYSPPTERLNRLLHCIEAPGIEKFLELLKDQESWPAVQSAD
ncbi:MAG: hypothetical protein A2087_05590 [Spirochaetes bacterium GWD1_61_31]|nr:MAG: hypothetical protein A2Y37_03600 [Spirochaetes bacterium GWB1_60_80]OHD35108.1 MAG: hypothetical protein A2004_05335 [Spirochaetes bacterium GWC1_61_12]OHD43627.1 MAG: hypothetical protein A2087_05590 [Spirochaetes bacterium GWD1_61_31]OHD44119.1 MAG: hypothetical protein A2Y35_02015 [Spirochaetes bacterium GWE1_60_18]OHD61840.1 MAG: hypothetical protein A2Y32_13860 [Spirochaetes bacterium GWF1_60_12]HAW85096.1 hypothetical protein [Spirochaetaceae bacterium]